MGNSGSKREGPEAQEGSAEGKALGTAEQPEISMGSPFLLQTLPGNACFKH